MALATPWVKKNSMHIKKNFRRILEKIAQLGLLARLVIFYTIFSVLVWGIIAVITWQSDARHVKNYLDTQIVLFAKTLAEFDLSHLSGEIDDIDEVLPERRKKPRFLVRGDHFGFAVFSKDGERILSDNDDGKDFPFISTKGFHKVEVDDDKWYIFVFINEHNGQHILVGQEKEYRQEIVHRAFYRHLVPWFILLPLFLMGLSWFLYKELRPLRELSQGLQKRKAQDLSPLDETHLTVETRPLVESLNALLQRISLLVEKERAFVSNAAHELRTPLAGLRLQAEVMAMCADDATARDNAMQKILHGSMRCSHLVEQLLLLSSLESQNTLQNASPVHWQKLVEQTKEDARATALEKNIELHSIVHDLPTKSLGLENLWAIALRNLVDNAMRYAKTSQGASASVCVHLYKDRLCVENTAPHIAAPILTQLGQRFYRPPGQEAQGSGLGLAIVNHITTLHNAKLRIENIMLDEEEGVRISIVF